MILPRNPSPCFSTRGFVRFFPKPGQNFGVCAARERGGCSAGVQVRREPRRETRGWMSRGLNHIQSCLVCPASISSINSHCQKVPKKSPNPGESCGFPSPCEDFGRETLPHFLTSPSFSFPWQCKKKHTLVCPDFAKKGVCPKGARCKLLHPQKKRQPRGDIADPPSKCQWLCEETGR